MQNMILMEGYLTKSPPKSIEDFIQIKRWKQRYFELKNINQKFILEYKKTKASKTLKGSIDLSNLEYLVNNFPFIRQRRNLFAIKIEDNEKRRIFYFNAKSINEFNNWIQNFISLLNLTASKMTLDRAKELILAGFFAKSYLKDEKEYSTMFMNSLNIFIQKKTTDDTISHRHECRKYYTTTNQYDETCLPIRCTSALSTDSNSDSSSDETLTEFIHETAENVQDHYMDLNQLEFKSDISKPRRKILPKDEPVEYCEIDTARTQAMYELNKRLDSI